MEETLPAPTEVEGEGLTTCDIYYGPIPARRIVHLYGQGMSIHKISKQAETPSVATIQRWIRDHSEFRVAMEGAKQAHALSLEGMALEAAEDAATRCADKDAVSAGRLLFDAYKWGAEVNDPAKYGKKVVHAGDQSQPIQFIIRTGFPDPNEFQTPPKLGADGIIERSKPIIEVQADGQSGPCSSEGNGSDSDDGCPQVGRHDTLCVRDEGHAPGEGSPRQEPVDGNVPGISGGETGA